MELEQIYLGAIIAVDEDLFATSWFNAIWGRVDILI